MTASNRRDLRYETVEDDYRGFDYQDEDNARGPLILALALGVLLVFGAVVWNTYRQGIRTGAGDIPIIAAEGSPYKRAPDDRGGFRDDDLNKRIYDQLDGSSRSAPPATSASLGTASAEEALLAQGGPPIELRPTQAYGEDGPDEEQIAALNDLVGARDAVEPAPAPVEEIILPPSIPAAIVEPESRFAFESSGTFLVQISALRSREAADAEWGKATRARPQMFRGADKSVQRADLGQKGVFYRLRAGAFESRADASEFCDALKADGGQCIVVQG